MSDKIKIDDRFRFMFWRLLCLCLIVSILFIVFLVLYLIGTPQYIYGDKIVLRSAQPTDQESCLHISQFEVYDNDNKLIPIDTIAFEPTIIESHVDPNIIKDGNYKKHAPTKCDLYQKTINIGFNQPVKINRIVVYNRSDPQKNGLKSASITIFNKNEALYNSNPFKYVSNVYVVRPHTKDNEKNLEYYPPIDVI